MNASSKIGRHVIASCAKEIVPFDVREFPMAFLLVHGSLFFSTSHDWAITLTVWAARHCISLSHITTKTKGTKMNRLLFLTWNMKWKSFQAHCWPPYRLYTCNFVVLGWYRVRTRGITQKHVLLPPKIYFCRSPLFPQRESRCLAEITSVWCSPDRQNQPRSRRRMMRPLANLLTYRERFNPDRLQNSIIKCYSITYSEFQELG